MALSPGELLEQARRAVPGTFDWVLYTAAAFDALVESRLVLVGGAAQVVHTKEHHPTDIDGDHWFSSESITVNHHPGSFGFRLMARNGPAAFHAPATSTTPGPTDRGQ